MIKVAFQIRDKKFVQLIAIHSSGTHIAMQNDQFNFDYFLSGNVETQCSQAGSVHESDSILQGPKCCLHPYFSPCFFFSESNMTIENTMEATLNSLKPNGSNAMGHAISAPDSCITNGRKKFSFFTPSTPSICNPS